MNTKTMVHARIDSKVKKEVEAILKPLGLTYSGFINLCFHKARIVKGIPFDLKITNKETIEAFEEIESGRGIKSKAKSGKELVEELLK